MRGRQQQQQQPKKQAGSLSRNRSHGTRSKSYFRLILMILFILVIVLVVLRDPGIPRGTRKKANAEEILRSTVTWGLNRWYSTGNTSSVSTSNEKVRKEEDISSTATVMGMAISLGSEMKRFVNSLRATGYSGHIILGVRHDIDNGTLQYFHEKRVIPKLLEFSNCTFEPFYTEETIKEEGDPRNIAGLTTCIKSYPDIKERWAKFPLARDWLEECPTCTGPVLISDIRDAYFQRNPFGPEQPEVKGLQVFEEHPNSTTGHWLVDWPVGDCKGTHIYKPMLCSGTTIGTREAMIKYSIIMYEEMKRWIQDPKCRFKTLADDQSIHNWLYYNGDFGSDAIAIRNREGIVNTVGFEGDAIFQAHRNHKYAINASDPETEPYDGASDQTWGSPEVYKITNENGEFTNSDGSVSAVIHQFDRLGLPFIFWLNKREESWKN